jgi:hypothetical protein
VTPRGAPKGKPQAKVGALTLANLILALQEGPQTCTDLAEITGLHRSTLWRYLHTFYTKKVIHIAEWHLDSNGHCNVRAYQLGNLPDAKKKVKRRTLARRQYFDRKRKQQGGLQAWLSHSEFA